MKAIEGNLVGHRFIQILGEVIIGLENVVDTPGLTVWANGGANRSPAWPSTVDASTNIELTPHWWDSSLKEPPRRAPKGRAKVRVKEAGTSENSAKGVNTNSSTEGAGLIAEITRTYSAAVGFGGEELAIQSRRPDKPSSVMIRAKPCGTYAGTVTAVDPAELGAAETALLVVIRDCRSQEGLRGGEEDSIEDQPKGRSEGRGEGNILKGEESPTPCD